MFKNDIRRNRKTLCISICQRNGISSENYLTKKIIGHNGFTGEIHKIFKEDT